MTTAMSLGLLFIAKMADNALSTVKTIMIQRNRSLLAGVAIALSSFLYFWITRSVVLADSMLTTLTVAVASGVGCFLVSGINNKLSKDRIYINVVMSDDMAAMQDFRDYLAKHHITNVASDSYTLDWNRKTLTVTAYAETKEQSRIINSYMENSDTKYKRVIHKACMNLRRGISSPTLHSCFRISCELKLGR